MDLVDYWPDEEIESRIRALQALDLKAADFAELRRLTMALGKGQLIQAPIYKPGIMLFRARIVAERPKSIVELGIPPPDKVADFGRANLPGQPVLYLNTLRNAVFFEVSPAAGAHLAVSHWESVADLLMFPVGYSETVFDELRSNRTLPSLGNTQHPRFNHPTNARLQAFFAQEFTKQVRRGEPWQFKFAAAVACNALETENIDGVMYPTVAMRANSDNFAIKRSSLCKVRLVKAEYVRVDSVGDFSFTATVLNVATDFDGQSINWQGTPRWTLGPGEMVKVVVENGQWRVYGIDGRPRLPRE